MKASARTALLATRTTRQRWARYRSSGIAADALPSSLFVTFAYNFVLRRAPDVSGREHFVSRLRTEEIGRSDVLDIMRGSQEFRTEVSYRDLLTSLHHSRCDFVRSLPRAKRILDLGGSHQSDRQGAFVTMGYPYPFEALTILDLPHEDRHEIYRHSERIEQVDTPLGPVFYEYGSMADLSRFSDCSFDLVYSGQTIEHVTPDDCDKTLAEVMRVLVPGGWLAVDTPNGPVCRLHSEQMINVDHQVEYSDEEFHAKLVDAGFSVVEAKGLNYLGHRASEGAFSSAEVARNSGMFAEIDDCYLLAYLARRPPE